MRRLSRPVLLRMLQIAVAAGLLALLWQVADGAQAARHLAGADPRWIVAAVAALVLQTGLSALRWRLTAAQLGIHLGRRAALREYFLSQIVNQLLPGGMLGDAGRAVRARGQAGLLASGQAVVLERLAGQIALLAVLGLTLAVTLAAPGGFVWPGWLLLSVIGLLAACLALPLAIRLGAQRLPGRGGRDLLRLARLFAQALTAPAVRWPQIGLSLGTALSNIAAFTFCAWAVGAALPVAAALALVPLILLAMVIPLTISGWGLREGAAAALFPLAGAGASEGLAASVAFGLVFLVSALPGAVVLGLGPASRPLKS